ncbi:MAG: fatty acid desaturase [Myxococcaceae bacterium]|nr:fatty acid desaturase [Myxococcaceae bacterium]
MRASFERRVGLTALLGVTLVAWVLDSFAAWARGDRSLTVHVLLVFYALYFTCIVIHDAVHGVLLPSRWLNDALGFGLSLVIGLPFPLLRHAHLAHHQRPGAESDPERAVFATVWWRLPLVLLMVPALYWRSFGRLPVRGRVATCAHGLVVLGAAAWLGPQVVGWGVPVLLAIGWFGFTTVYVPHCAHSTWLMKRRQFHSGWHHDHHRDVRYGWAQYAQLRAFHLRCDGATDAVTEVLARAVWVRASCLRRSKRFSAPQN